MALFVDKYGAAVHVDGGREDTDEELDNLRDMIIAVLHAQKMPIRKIGRLFRIHNTTVLDILNEIPDWAKELYGRLGIQAIEKVEQQKRARSTQYADS